MHFLHPEFLYYLLPPLVILFGLLLTQKSQEESYFSSEVMEKLRVSANTLTLQARNALFFLIGALIILALAGPVIDEGSVEVKAKSADIMIALDISDSMLAEDVYPNRLKLAKQKALDLLKLSPDERLGVIAFAKNSYLVSPLSFDSNAVAFLLRSLNTDSITEKGTNFLSMLEVVAKSIKNEDKKYLLILSDGGDSSDFSEEISYAKEHNIVVFVLGVGTTKGAPIKRDDGSFIKQNGEILISKLNENISRLATQTGGVYIKSVNSRNDIEAMLREIRSHSKQKELKSKEIKRFIPLFYYPLGLALLLLLIATSSMSKRKKLEMPLALLLCGLFLTPMRVDAGILDFVELEEAKSAYESGDYAKAEKLYSDYEAKTSQAETHYNIANSLYKEGKYKQAVEHYQKALFDSDEKRAKNAANLGNAYVKSKQKGSLQKAVEAYERSLKLVEDKETRENLEAVKKAIEEKKKEQNKQQKQQNKQNKKQDKNNKKQNQEKNKSDKNKNKNEQQNKEEKSKEQQQKENQKKEKSKESQQKDAQSKKEKSEKQENKQAEKLKEQAKDKSLSSMKKAQEKMSESEEKKWMQRLDKRQSTFMYKLNKESKFKEQSDAKPW